MKVTKPRLEKFRGMSSDSKALHPNSFCLITLSLDLANFSIGLQVSKNDKLDIQKWFNENKDSLKLLDDMHLPSLQQYAPDTWEATVRNDLLSTSHNRVVFIMWVSNNENYSDYVF